MTQENGIDPLTMTQSPANNIRHEFTLYGRTHTLQVGSYIEPEGWFLGNCVESSEWDKAEFFLSTYSTTPKRLAVNLVVTGCDFQYRPHSDARWVKVQIEFVGDGEPSTFISGWWMIET